MLADVCVEVEFIQMIAGKDHHNIIQCTVIPRKGELVTIESTKHPMHGTVAQVIHQFHGHSIGRIKVHLK